MAARTRWVRTLVDEGWISSSFLIALLNYAYEGELYPEADSEAWFPKEHRFNPHYNYLVNPARTKERYLFAEMPDDVFADRGLETAWRVTEVAWGLFSWNPRAVYVQQDGYYQRMEVPFAATEKPTWADIVRWEVEHQVSGPPDPEARDATDGWWNRVVGESRDALVAAPAEHPTLGSPVETGTGLSHLPAMAYIGNRSPAAGLVRTRSVMSTSHAAADGGELVDVWTERELHDVLEPLADRTNHIESARNIVRRRIWQLRNPIFTADAGLGKGATEDEIRAEKVRLLNAIYDLAKPEALDAAIGAEAAKIAANTDLPADFERGRQVLIERLEASATGHQKALKGALTQQAIDNWAQCVDLDEALVEIAKQCRIGVLKITNATHTTWKKVSGAWEKAPPQEGPVDHEGEGDPEATLGEDGELYRDTASGIPNAKAIFDAGVAAIRAVRVLNTPAVSYNISGRLVTVRAEQPSVDPPIEGPLAAAHYGFAGLEGTDVRSGVDIKFYAPSKDTDPLIQTYDFDDSFAGKVRITLTVANLCGPTDFDLDLEVTANGSIRRV